LLNILPVAEINLADDVADLAAFTFTSRQYRRHAPRDQRT
jgi:hypothetical protein